MSYFISSTEIGTGALSVAKEWYYEPDWIYAQWTPEQRAMVAIVHASATEPGPGVVGVADWLWWEHPSPGVVTGVFIHQLWDAETEQVTNALFAFSGTYTPAPTGVSAPTPSVTSVVRHPADVAGVLPYDWAYGYYGVFHGELADTSEPAKPPFWCEFVNTVEIP